jgi:uncharacterized membrane protein YoaK (UPF0700 family)
MSTSPDSISAKKEPPAPGGPSIGLWAPIMLGIIAGFVDAIAFVHLFGVFPANQSGNAILVGISIGELDSGKILPPITSLTGFALGVFFAVRLAFRLPPRWQTELLLLLQVLLLALTAVRLQFLPLSDLPLTGTEGFFALLFVSGAMGVQTYAVHSTSGIPVATTYQSGAVDQIARRAAIRSVGHTWQHPTRLVVLFSVFISYIVGAALGAVLGDAGPRLLWLSCIGTGVILLIRLLERRRRGESSATDSAG